MGKLKLACFRRKDATRLDSHVDPDEDLSKQTPQRDQLVRRLSSRKRLYWCHRFRFGQS
jgi:hypothetical protein